MYEQIIVGVGFVLLLLLCLPLAGIQKLILEVTSGLLRLTLLALLAAAAYLWFRPEHLPVEATEALDSFPRLKSLLPEPGTPYFGMSVAVPILGALLPILAVLDVSRKLAGWRLRRLRALAAQPRAEAPPPAPAPAPAPQRGTGPILRRVDRRGAADTLAAAGPRRS